MRIELFIFLSVLAGLMVLIQWHVITSVRRYVLEKYRPVGRGFGYGVLIAVGSLNFIGIAATFDTTMFAPDSAEQKILAVSYFSYLGLMLGLALFFLIMDIFGFTLNIPDYCRRAYRSVRNIGGKVPELVKPSRGSSDNEADDRALPSVGRRAFLKWSACAGVTATVGLAGSGVAQAFDDPVLEEFDVVHPALKGLRKPIRIVQVTDFHYGMFLGSEELRKLVQRLNNLDADMIVITGDLFHTRITPVAEAAPILAELRPRSMGNLVVLGNHDFYAGEARVLDAVDKAGLTLVRDEWLHVGRDGVVIDVGGIDDPMTNWMWGTQFPRFEDFRRKIPNSTNFRLLLSHRPAVLPLASAAGIDMVLSGHIHGGQIIMPVPGSLKGWSLAGIVSPYTHGWYRSNNTHLYLNRGVGLTFVPWRINCPPEIAVFTLRPSETPDDGAMRVTRSANGPELRRRTPGVTV